ncbi:MAG: DNA polymerase Y family protein, partial [Candidatus Hydrogenedentes bacterium]|nr:DNA polymerase Y family protein [Candidatus Hydrogenedentota bacterium]
AVESAMTLDYPEENLDRLQIQCALLLEPLRAELAARHQKLTSLRVSLVLDDRSEQHTEITPATPTLDAKQLIALLRLRMDTLPLSTGVVELALHATGVMASQHQLTLFHDAPRGSLDAVYQALTRVRAEFGDDAVCVARLQDRHLPEARYTWERLQHLPLPKPAGPAMAPLIRRVYTPPIELPPRGRREPDGWILARIADGPVEEIVGPQVIAGGWWAQDVSRAYYYARTQDGRWLWIYHDLKRRRWFLQGEVQ